MKYLLPILILLCLMIPASAGNNPFMMSTNNIFETEVTVQTPTTTVQIQKEEVIVNACAGGACTSATSKVAVRSGPVRTVVRATVRRPVYRWRIFSRRSCINCR